MKKEYTTTEVNLIKRQLNLEGMPTWIVWAYMDEQGISSERVLAAAPQSLIKEKKVGDD